MYSSIPKGLTDFTLLVEKGTNAVVTNKYNPFYYHGALPQFYLWVLFLSGLLLFAYSNNLYLSLVFSVLGGFSSICQTSVIITIIQSETDSKYRGRVVSFIAMAIFGMLPLGSLAVGYLAPIIGAPLTLLMQGILALIIGIVFYKNLMNYSTL